MLEIQKKDYKLTRMFQIIQLDKRNIVPTNSSVNQLLIVIDYHYYYF